MSAKELPAGNEACAKVVIVGGSLSGLTFALACATRGIHTRVLEQFDGLRRSGAALGVDRSALLRAVGLDARDNGISASFPVITGYRKAVAWKDLHDWLRGQAHRRDEITLTNGITISKVMQGEERATAVTSEGMRIDAPVIVGADGYRSIVRRAINPGRPAPLYAGYLLWRGLVDEAELPATVWPDNNDGVALLARDGYRLVAYPVAGRQSSLRPGERMISFAWYDGTRDDLLQKSGCLSPTGHVLSSLAAEHVPAWVLAELRELAPKVWPEPWRSVIVHALEQRSVFATPVAEYFPERLIHDRLAIIGDAAHVISPQTGQGFAASAIDADVLATCLKNSFVGIGHGVNAALKLYEARRLRPAQDLATISGDWSRAFCAKKRENKT